MSAFISPRRLAALCRKEGRQILRDPSTWIIAFLLPLVLLLIFGYGINLDSTRVRIGLLNEDGGAESLEFAQQLSGSPYLEVTPAHDRMVLDDKLQRGEIRGFVVLPADFTAQNMREGGAPVQVIADGSEPNTANFVTNYVRGVWSNWNASRIGMKGASLDVQPRYWFNPAAESRHYLIPGSMAIIMTVIGALLTSLVVAREWERGTMEALLASPVTRAELLLSKLVPYYLLGVLSMVVVTASAVLGMGVPFRGSWWLLAVVTTFFLSSVLGIGLLISSVTRDQFNSAQTALNVAFLPAVMLSGFLFEITSMPAPLRALTYLLPPRYFVSALQTLFLSGDVWAVLWKDLAFLIATSALFLGLAARATTRRLDA